MLRSLSEATLHCVLQANWTPLHCAVHSGHVDCLDLLLSYQRHSANQNSSTAKMVGDVISMADKDGWTITHLAATRESKVLFCLNGKYIFFEDILFHKK